MKKNIFNYKNILLVILLFLTLNFFPIRITKANCGILSTTINACESGDASACNQYCKNSCIANSNDPIDQQLYNSQACTSFRIGFQEINTKTIFVERNPELIIANVIAFLLGAIVALVIIKIALSGISIAAAKEDADKRKQAYAKTFNALIGLAVGLLAFGLSIFIRTTLVNRENADLLIKCQQLRDMGNTDESIIKECERIEKRI